MFKRIQATFAELKVQYPHMMDPVNRHLHGDYFENISDDELFDCIEFTRLQFMAWASGGPFVETLSVTMCEDLVKCYVTHVVMDTSINGD